MNNGREVIEWIHSLLPFGIKPGLKRMEWLLKQLHHPEKRIQTIHIGGTNGKGSTVSFMRHALEEAGYQVGTFTSPYIECFEERISVNGQPIDEESLIKCGKIIRPLVEKLAKTELGSPTEFEVITAIAFYYFADMARPDIVLVEVGLGGRLDSTNVISPILSIITSIGFDHMHILGDTLAEITNEKAGIIKENTPLISGVAQEESRDILQKIAKGKKAQYEQLRIHFQEQVQSVNEAEQTFLYTTEEGECIEYTIQMKGPHQRENAAVAIHALKKLARDFHFNINDHAIRLGMKKTTWVGRFEQISDDPFIIIDGAHNGEGMESLAKTLIQHYPHKRYRFVIAATIEKNMRTLLKPFEQSDATFTFTTFDFFRAAQAESLYEQANVPKKKYDVDWKQAIEKEINSLEKNEMLIICGSLYFISEVRRNLVWNKMSVKVLR